MLVNKGEVINKGKLASLPLDLQDIIMRVVAERRHTCAKAKVITEPAIWGDRS